LPGSPPTWGILILSRIAQGLGAGGVSALAMIVMAAMIPPCELGRYSGMFGAVFGVASTVTLAIVASVLVGVAMFGGTIFLSQYFQIALGKSPTVAGLMSLPMIFGLLVSSTVAGQLITRYGRWKAYLVSGAVVMTAGLLLLSRIDAHTSVPVVSVYMAVLGVGMLMQIWCWRRRTTWQPPNSARPPRRSRSSAAWAARSG
jgi:MFS family permease